MDNELVVAVMAFMKIIRNRKALLLKKIFDSRKRLIERFRKRRKLQKMLITNRMIIPEMIFQFNRPRFRSKPKLRNDVFWQEIISDRATEADFIEMFRMSKNTFEIICNKIRHIIETPTATAVAVEKKVAVTLYKLASCYEYSVIGNMFGLHKSTVHKCFYQVVKAINTLREEQIKFPNLDEALVIASKFKRMTKMENIIGGIDGTHIPILPPKTDYKNFVNSKGWPSLVLQGVVDNNSRFRDVCIRFPGNVDDATVFKNSGLFKNSEKIIPKYSRKINGVDTPLMLVADPAYPMIPWLLQPYVGTWTEEEESFNSYHNSCYIVVEKAFRRLKARWQCLSKRADIKNTFISEVVLACCILHNIVEEHEDPFISTWIRCVEKMDKVFQQPVCKTSQEIIRTKNFDPKFIRTNLKSYMLQLHPLKKSSFWCN